MSDLIFLVVISPTFSYCMHISEKSIFGEMACLRLFATVKTLDFFFFPLVLFPDQYH